jgi:hypothetical protein
MKSSGRVNEILLFLEPLDYVHFLEIFTSSENFKCCDASRQNLFSNFVDLVSLAYLPWLILQPSVASTVIFSMNLDTSPLPFYRRIFLRRILSIYVNWKILKNATHIHLTAIAIDYHDRTQATTHCCLEPFWWESLRV